MTSATRQFLADPEIVACEFGEGSALLDLRSGTYFTTNSVGKFVWGLVASPLTFNDIRRAVTESFDVGDEQCACDLEALLDDMVKAKLITACHVASV